MARRCRLPIALALVFSASLVGFGPSAAVAQVSAVTGSAYGFSANVSLFGGPAVQKGPAPTVTLPAAGSATPVSVTDPSDAAVFGPAHIYDSGPTTVTTQGSPGPTGSVTSSVSIAGCTVAVANSCAAGEVYAGPFTATSVANTCTVAAAVNGGPTFVNGNVVTSTDSNGVALTNQAVPGQPAPNTVITGTINTTGVNGQFKWTFNERITNPDGSLTINAAHEILGFNEPPPPAGSPARGDLIIGQVVCGATSASTTTTSTTSTTTGSTTTTSTTAPTTTTSSTTTTVIQVGGSAFGYYTLVGLFGGAQVARGPTPKVTLPPGGSATPVSANVALGSAVYGPAHIFESGPVTVSTQGTPGASGSVTSSTSIAGCPTAVTNSCSAGQVYAGAFTASSVASICTANAAGITGSTTVVGGQVVTLDDANGTAVTTKTLPNPLPPNYTLEGRITSVDGSFKFVFNEQIVNPNGSITVNAGHEYIGGGTGNAGPALGDLIFGQSVCARAASTSGSQVATVAAAASPSLGAGGSLPASGTDAMQLLMLALLLLAAGWAATFLAGDRGDEDGAPPG